MDERDRWIRVKGGATDLEVLRHELLEELGGEVAVAPESEEVPTELREPVVVALIVAFASTASVTIKTIGGIIERRMLHTEVMERLRIFREDGREIAVEALTGDELRPPLCLFDVTQEMLDREGLDPVVAVFEEIEASNGTIRRLQGSVAFRFPGQEEHGDEVWRDEKVLAWGRALFNRLPYLLYYLDPDPGLRAMAFVVHAFVGFAQMPGDAEGAEEWTAEEEGLFVAAHLLVAAAIFADHMAEDWRMIVPPLAGTLEPSFGAEVMRLVEVALDGYGEGDEPG